jgi:hypothetical protein
MKKFIASILLSSVLFLGAFVNNAQAKTIRSKGYFKSSGKYVMPYFKTSPNRTKFDNYSTKGNYNPFTGKKGTVSPYKSFKFK